MPVLLAILGALAAAGFWWYRIKVANDMAKDIFGAANDARLAARRFGFRRRKNVHPADMIDDPRLAAAGVAAAVAEMDAPLSRAEIAALATEARAILNANTAEATDIAAFGRWVAGQCGNQDEAVRRLAKVVLDKAGAEAGPDLLDYVNRVANADEVEMNERQTEALDRVSHRFGLTR